MIRCAKIYQFVYYINDLSRYESALETYLQLVDEINDDEDSLTLKTAELTLNDSIRSTDDMSDSLKSFIADQVCTSTNSINWSSNSLIIET